MASMSRRFQASHQPRASAQAASSLKSCIDPPSHAILARSSEDRHRSRLDHDLRRRAANRQALAAKLSSRFIRLPNCDIIARCHRPVLSSN
jgi:hypothetical protein